MMVLQLRVTIAKQKADEEVPHTFDLDVLASDQANQQERDLVEEMENVLATVLKKIYPQLKMYKGMATAPKDRPIIGVVNGEEVEVEWAEQRQCMLAGIGGGNGYYGPGWQDTYNHLISDEPTKWREVE